MKTRLSTRLWRFSKPRNSRPVSSKGLRSNGPIFPHETRCRGPRARDASSSRRQTRSLSAVETTKDFPFRIRTATRFCLSKSSCIRRKKVKMPSWQVLPRAIFTPRDFSVMHFLFLSITRPQRRQPR